NEARRGQTVSETCRKNGSDQEEHGKNRLHDIEGEVDKEQDIVFAVTAKKGGDLPLCKFHAQMLYKGLAQYSSGKYHGENQIVFF
ncbi:MAG TPA: hypothetical protein VLV31_08985, partial [Candidatus Acidoferrales bacterium]|nr:hypothetical protein [Candidatus Acidoferrales bacterium]